MTGRHGEQVLWAGQKGLRVTGTGDVDGTGETEHRGQHGRAQMEQQGLGPRLKAGWTKINPI